MTDKEETLALTIPMEVTYTWSTGPHFEKFFKGLREGKILANKCYLCGRLQLPPTNVCGRCHVEIGEEWVELSHKGNVISYSFVVDPIYDSGTGDMREVPYTIASIVLDGGPDVAFFHKLEEKDPQKVTMGMRVEAVFKPEEERQGLITDIIHFRTIKE